MSKHIVVQILTVHNSCSWCNQDLDVCIRMNKRRCKFCNVRMLGSVCLCQSCICSCKIWVVTAMITINKFKSYFEQLCRQNYQTMVYLLQNGGTCSFPLARSGHNSTRKSDCNVISSRSPLTQRVTSSSVASCAGSATVSPTRNIVTDPLTVSMTTRDFPAAMGNRLFIACNWKYC